MLGGEFARRLDLHAERQHPQHGIKKKHRKEGQRRRRVPQRAPAAAARGRQRGDRGAHNGTSTADSVDQDAVTAAPIAGAADPVGKRATATVPSASVNNSRVSDPE